MKQGLRFTMAVEFDIDTFMAEPTTYYYAQIDTNGICTAVIESTDGTLADSTNILLDGNADVVGHVYRNGVFMPVNVLILLLVEQMANA